MALKKSNKIDSSFSMSSMTDIIFLLLLFFMIASTMSAPNDMKVNLPQSSAKTATKAKIVKIGINAEGEYKDALAALADAEKAKKWIATGAQPTDTVKVLLKKSNII